MDIQYAVRTNSEDLEDAISCFAGKVFIDLGFAGEGTIEIEATAPGVARQIAELKTERAALRSAAEAALHDLISSDGLAVSDHGEAWILHHPSIVTLRAILERDRQ